MAVLRRTDRFANGSHILIHGLLAVSGLMLATHVLATQDPEAVYRRSCIICHSSGHLSIPQKGDTSAWRPLFEKGEDELLKNVVQGYGLMPAGGLCLDCSEEDYRTIIRWMSQ